MILANSFLLSTALSNKIPFQCPADFVEPVKRIGCAGVPTAFNAPSSPTSKSVPFLKIKVEPGLMVKRALFITLIFPTTL